MKDYYCILELRFPASEEAIKESYRRLSKQYHPDRGGSEELMKELNEAYSVLDDPVKKAAYDRDYEAAFCRKESSYSSAWAYVAASIALVVTLMGFKAVESIENISLRATSERMMTETEEGMLEGLYTVRSIGGDGVTYSTAELQMVGHNGCIITVLSDYEPLELRGTISGGSRLNCDLLGEGLVSYKPSTGAIVIRFDNTEIDKICEFLK